MRREASVRLASLGCFDEGQAKKRATWEKRFYRAGKSVQTAIQGKLSSRARPLLNNGFVDDIWDEAVSKYGSYGVSGEVLGR